MPHRVELTGAARRDLAGLQKSVLTRLHVAEEAIREAANMVDLGGKKIAANVVDLAGRRV